jgi:hypothetical protein
MVGTARKFAAKLHLSQLETLLWTTPRVFSFCRVEEIYFFNILIFGINI